MDFEQARTNMIRHQIRTWDVLDPAVLDAMAQVPREDYVPPHYRAFAFADMNIPLSHGQVMLKPMEEARILQALALQPTDTVLEIGTGSGYMTGLLAHLAKYIYSIEIFADFSTQAQSQLARHGIKNITLSVGDALANEGEQDFYDVIVITGSIPVPMLPEFFLQNLKPGGRLFIILGTEPVMEATLFTHRLTGEWTQEKLFETVVPALINAPQPPAFTF